MPQVSPFCRHIYVYFTAWESHLKNEHEQLSKQYFPHLFGNPSASQQSSATPFEWEEADENWGPTNTLDMPPEYDSNEEPAGASDEENEVDAPLHAPTTAITSFPDAGRSAGKAAGFLEAQKRLLDDPIFPFHTSYDFHLAKWFIDTKTMKAGIEDYFKKGLYQGAGSYRSAYTLFKVIENLPTTLGAPSWEFMKEVVDGESFVLAHRDPMVCIRYLIGQAAYSKDMVYAPIRELNLTGERMYSELHTADWWWDLQETLPPGSTVVPVLCTSDQTHLTNFSGDKKAWPIYLTIGNIKSTVRNKTSTMAMVLLALLPVPPKFGKLKTKEAEAQRVRNRVILDLVMDKILSTLYEPATNSIELTCVDGQLRFCFPILCGWIADHLEHVTLQHMKNNCCPVCEIDAENLGLLTILPFSTRNHEEYKAKAQQFGDTGNIENLDWLQERGLKAAMNSFWRLPRVRPEEIWKPDLLHTIYLGLLKHLMEWIQGLLKKYNRLDQFDRVWKSIPPYTGITIPKKAYREVTQWQGKEMRNLGRFLLAALTVALRKPTASERPAFKEALHCTQALLDFHLMAQYRSHTEQTLGYMEDYLRRFHEHKDVFLEFRRSKQATAKAKQADTVLKQAQEKALSAAQRTASEKRKAAAEDRLERSEQSQDIYRQESHFNFIKIHLLTHFTSHIKRFGNIPSYSTEVGEASHQQQIKVGYRASNKNNATKQILEHYSRRHTISMHVVAVQEAARGRSAEDLGEEVIDLLQKEMPSLAELDIPSECRPPRVLRSLVSTKRTRSLKDVAYELGDQEDQLVQKVVDYSNKSLPDSHKLPTNIQKLLHYPAERFKQLQLPVLRFQETDIYTIHRLRCTIQERFRGAAPRNDWVWVAAGDETQFGALRGRLPGQLRCLFKLRDPTTGHSHRLALVRMLRVEGAGRLESDSSLVRVASRKVSTPYSDEWVISVASIIGMAHLIPDEEEEQWLVNSRIDLETFNNIY